MLRSRFTHLTGFGADMDAAVRDLIGIMSKPPQQSIVIRLLEPSDVEPMAAAFRQLGWESNKPASQYKRYLDEQETGARTVLLLLTRRVSWVISL